jgi:hypothetical protein
MRRSSVESTAGLFRNVRRSARGINMKRAFASALVAAVLSGCASHRLPSGVPTSELSDFEVCKAKYGIGFTIQDRNRADERIAATRLDCSPHVAEVRTLDKNDAQYRESTAQQIDAVWKGAFTLGLVGAVAAAAVQPPPVNTLIINNTFVVQSGAK